MATIKVNQIAAELNKRERKARSAAMQNWKKRAKPLIKKEINTRLDKGVSPVHGVPNFVPYSPKYKIGRKRPIDLRLTGKMRKTLRAYSTTDGIGVSYSSPIHKYVNGEGRVRRATLPIDSKGERFKNNIRKNLRDLFIKVFRIK